MDSEMHSHSMIRRLVIGLMAGLAVLWLFAAGFGLSVMEEEYGEMFDGSLQGTAERLVPLVVDDILGKGEMTAPQRLKNGDSYDVEEAGKEYLVYQVRSIDGRMLFHSQDSPGEPFDIPLKRGFWSDENFRYYTATGMGETIFVQVADALENRSEALTESGLALFLPILALLPLSFALIWIVATRTLSPIERLRAGIEEKDSGNMEPLQSDDLPDELEPIATSVNNLLERLRKALTAEREFTANSAHELRTPIAGALAQTQMLIAEIGDQPALHRATQIETSLRKLHHLAEKLLQLSRAEAGLGIADHETDLVPVLEMMVEDIRRGENGSRLAVRLDPNAHITGFYNADAFGIALRNLVENAFVHGNPTAPVELVLAADGSISVANGGPVYGAAELAKFKGRFQRGRTDANGSGLGLSIASNFLNSMNAELELHSPARGKADGFEAVIRFQKRGIRGN